ncbi:hypothetical protein JKP88DRAFT_267390 [Tribonema minus]|uniref:Uncharacterized protein n=1 Tax=Tribonema minus TaxID=303371 RepID=A0A835ZDC8_9STRA|nr:hypothetical protein JKP88DRAFT_267390 [Tribonema minus]
MPRAAHKHGLKGLQSSEVGGRGRPSTRALLALAASDLAVRALQVLAGWNRQSVQAQSAALEGKPRVEHVYTLFWECQDTGNAWAQVIGAFATAQAANDAALAFAGITYEKLSGNQCSFDGNRCITFHAGWRHTRLSKLADVCTYRVRKHRLQGSIRPAAPLDAATACALHVAAGVPPDAAAALRDNLNLRSKPADNVLFAVEWFYTDSGRDGGQLRSVWRSRVEAKQEARKLTGEDECQRVRRAVHDNCEVPNQGAGIASDESIASDGERSRVIITKLGIKRVGVGRPQQNQLLAIKKGSKRVMSHQPDGSRFFPQTPTNASLALRALQVLVGWNRERVQEESAALEEKPAVEHVYTLFYESPGSCGAASVCGIYTSVEAGNDAALAAGCMKYEHLYADISSFNSDGCLTLRFNYDYSTVHTVRKQRLHGSMPSAAPLDAATARALHVAAGAQLDSAAALFANADLRSSRVDDKLFAVLRYYRGYGEAGGQLRRVWRSRTEAMQEARKLTGGEEWQRMRRAVRRGRHFYSQGAVTAGDNLSDDSGASDGDDKGDEDDDDGCYSELEYCDVFERRRLPRTMPKGGSKRVKSSRRDGGSLSTSLAGRALKVLVGWNKEGVQAESATLAQKPAVEHVYTLFWECLGTGNADAEVRGIYMNAEAGNDAALAAGGIEYEDLYDDVGTFDRDGCLTLHFEGNDAPFDDVWTVRKQRLRGSVPSAAPLDAATARALHVAAGAPRDAAAALSANANLRASRVGATLFAVVRYFSGGGEDGGQLKSVWRSSAEARREARRETGEDEWQRLRRAARRGGYFRGSGAVTARDDMSDEGGDSDGEGAGDDFDGDFDDFDDEYGFDVCDVHEVKLTC